MSNIDDKIKELVEQNNDRVKKVEELTQQIESFKQGIAQIKEEHDFTRGQIVALQGLQNDDSSTAKPKAKAKEK